MLLQMSSEEEIAAEHRRVRRHIPHWYVEIPALFQHHLVGRGENTAVWIVRSNDVSSRLSVESFKTDLKMADYRSHYENCAMRTILRMP